MKIWKIFVIFCVRQTPKNAFGEKYFPEKMTSLKLFYDGNHFTSKQTEHKKMYIVSQLCAHNDIFISNALNYAFFLQLYYNVSVLIPTNLNKSFLI